MRNAYVPADSNVVKQVGKTEKVYTQNEIDLIDEQYKEREEKFKKITQGVQNEYLDTYRKNLIPDSVPVPKETIVFNQHTGKWCIIKEEADSKR